MEKEEIRGEFNFGSFRHNKSFFYLWMKKQRSEALKTSVSVRHKRFQSFLQKNKSPLNILFMKWLQRTNISLFLSSSNILFDDFFVETGMEAFPTRYSGRNS